MGYLLKIIALVAATMVPAVLADGYNQHQEIPNLDILEAPPRWVGKNKKNWCQIEHNIISTFDGATQRFHPICQKDGCFKLLHGNCNNPNDLAVSAKHLQTREITLKFSLLGGNSTILAAGSPTSVTVTVDGKPVSLPKTIFVDGQNLGTIRKWTKGIIFTVANQSQSVEFSGSHILIKGDGGLSVGCGLCWNARE